MKSFDLKLIAKLSLLGPLLGVFVVAGAFNRGLERVAGFVVFAFCAVVIARRGFANPFAQGAVTGFIVGSTYTLVQGLFVDALLANNPWYRLGLPEGADPQFHILRLVPFIGVATALVTGVMTLLAQRFLASREKENT